MRLMIIIFVLASCAKFVPYNGPKSKEEIIQTGKSKNAAYDDSLAFLAKYVRNSNDAIKVKEKDTGRIVAKITYSCKLMTVLNDPFDADVGFDVDLSFKDKRVKSLITLTGYMDGMDPATATMKSYPIYQSEKQPEQIQACLDELMASISKGISLKRDSDW